MRLPIVGGPLPIFHGMPPSTRSSKKNSNNNKKEKNENNNKKIIRSLQNTTKKTRTNARKKLKEKEDLNDKLTNKLQECRAQRLSKKMAQRERRSGRRSIEKKCGVPRLSKNKSEKKEVSSHKGGVALYTS